jgi:hypothetical protein
VLPLGYARPNAIGTDYRRFAIAHLLQERGIPVVFLTGYDEKVIRPEFTDAPRLGTPVELRRPSELTRSGRR